jgi:hypothetical protein
MLVPILGPIGIGREYSRNRLADIVQPLPRQERLAIGAWRLGGRVTKTDRRRPAMSTAAHTASGAIDAPTNHRSPLTTSVSPRVAPEFGGFRSASVCRERWIATKRGI